MSLTLRHVMYREIGYLLARTFRSSFGRCFAMSAKATTVDCPLRGPVLLNNPYFNKDAAFPEDEREKFQLVSLLPPGVQTLEQQMERAYNQYNERKTNLDKNLFLNSLRERNLVLYYSLLLKNIKEMFSIVYTPTESDAIKNYHRIFRHPDGCFLNINDMDRIGSHLKHWGKPDDIDYIVVTDAEQILGIGDQGVNGILIAVAKLVLATLVGGVHPQRTLPIVLDCGTDNEELRDHELYMGLRQKRERGAKYDEFLDKFVQAVRERFPHAYLHFEDFGVTNARKLLDKYRSVLPCFNDDIQGTGCVVMASILSALKIRKQELNSLHVVIYGAGSAGTGIADQICNTIVVKTNMNKKDAARMIWLVDKEGLVTTKSKNLVEGQKPYARDAQELSDSNCQQLCDVIKMAKANVLIGTSAQAGAFKDNVLKAMAEASDQPLILPLSNPTSLMEAKPVDILEATNGKALVATGSPCEPVKGKWGKDGEEIEIAIAECNNSVVFPGLGLGVITSRAKAVSDAMLVAAIDAVANASPAVKNQNETAELLPSIEEARDVSLRVAVAVYKQAIKEFGENTDRGQQEVESWIKNQMWSPVYRSLKPVETTETVANSQFQA